MEVRWSGSDSLVIVGCYSMAQLERASVGGTPPVRKPALRSCLSENTWNRRKLERQWQMHRHSTTRAGDLDWTRIGVSVLLNLIALLAMRTTFVARGALAMTYNETERLAGFGSGAHGGTVDGGGTDGVP